MYKSELHQSKLNKYRDLSFTSDEIIDDRKTKKSKKRLLLH